MYRKGRVGRGIFLGVLGGTVAGAIVGGASYKRCYNCWLDFGIGLNILVGAVTGLLFGGIVGLILGTGKHKFAINRTKEGFEKMRVKLMTAYGHKEK